MPFGLNGGSAPAPMTWKKGEEGKGGEDAGVGVVNMPVIAPEGATGGSLQPLLGERSPPPRRLDRRCHIASACLRPIGSRQAGAGGPRGMTVTLCVLQVIRGTGGIAPT